VLAAVPLERLVLWLALEREVLWLPDERTVD